MKKSIKTRILVIVCLLVTLSLLSVGATVAYLMYKNSFETLNKTMSETALTSADLVVSSLENFKAVAAETGALTRLSNPEIALEDKRKIINDKVAQYNFLFGNVVDISGKGILSEVDVSDRDYFKKALSGETSISDVLMSRSLNKYVITVAAPLWEGGKYNTKVVGAIYFLVDAKILSEITNHITVGETGVVYMLDKDGYTIASYNPDALINRENTIVDSQTNKELEACAEVEKKMIAGQAGFGKYRYGGTNYLQSYAPLSINNWSIALAVDEKEYIQSTINAIIIAVIIIVIAVIIGIVVSILLANAITNPVREIEGVARNLAQGKISSNVKHKSDDEVGQLANSVVIVSTTISSLVDNINKLVVDYNKGNIDARIDESLFEGEYKTLSSGINSIVDSAVNDTLEIIKAFGQLGSGSFDTTIKNFPGKKAIANEKFNELKQTINSLDKDLSVLIENAIQGKLDSRVNSGSYSGGWNKITIGLNNLLTSVHNPIQEVNDILTQLSKGNFDVHINKNFKGSFAEMMVSLDTMVKAIGSYIEEITDILAKIAEGDLRNNISRDYVGKFGLIKESINNIGSTLRSTISEIKVSSSNVLIGAKQISQSSMDLANGASTQASSLQELNASITTINDKTQISAVEAKAANELSSKSMLSAKDGNGEMIKMLDSMNDIKEASNNISKIIKVIDDIAFQTNLLALNAAVEAARAGEHGKGFAVVAEEVRSLAGRSLKAAKDTSNLIEDTITKINEGTSTAQQTADSLKKIISDTNSVSEIIDRIYYSANEQAEGISQITVGINQISDVVQRNSATSEETASAAEELNSQSELLAQMVANFKI